MRIIKQNNQLLVNSREVADKIGKQHNDLMKSIRNYADHLTKGNFTLSDFFIESSYQDSTSRTLPCFMLTRKGCDMVANKLTGRKGVLFTAEYVTKFEEMEREQNKVPVLTERQAIIQSIKLAAEIAEEMEAVKATTQENSTKIIEIEQKLDTQITLNSGEQRRLQRAISHKIYTIEPLAEERPELFRQLHREIKDRWQVGSYKDVLRQDLQGVLNYISVWRPIKKGE
ncbi:Rha family transcriptional regulator [Paenibacillus sp. ALE1]